MKRGIIGLVIVCTLASIPAAAAQAAEAVSIEGYWLGTLDLGSAKLRVAFNIKKNPDGVLTATLDSIDQGAKGIPVDSVVFESDRLALESKAVRGRYEGLLKPATGEIEGTWSQGGLNVPLTLKKQDKPVEIKRPQEPVKPYPYNEEEVSYRNAQAEIKLAGTLTTPRSAGPHPAVILISGSGAQDRNETVFNHRPFLVLADSLTRRGLAVLRVDDRGAGGSGGNLNVSTTEDLAGDVLAGIAFLKSRPEVDPQRIGLIGHSEGGLIAPLVASRSADAAFIVLLAGPGLVGEEIILLQGDLISRASGASEERLRQNAELQKKIFSVIKEEKDPAKAEKALSQVLEELFQTFGEEDKKGIKDKDIWIQGQVQSVNNAWFRFFLTYDPLPALRKVRCPVLGLFGEKDLQVPAEANLKAVEKALREGGNTRFRLEKLAGLNHLFQTAGTGAPSEYGTIEETMAPSALKFIGDWILEVTAAPQPR